MFHHGGTENGETKKKRARMTQMGTDKTQRMSCSSFVRLHWHLLFCTYPCHPCQLFCGSFSALSVTPW
jgi:hypothetical protein